jgi:hypothetical protein
MNWVLPFCTRRNGAPADRSYSPDYKAIRLPKAAPQGWRWLSFKMTPRLNLIIYVGPPPCRPQPAGRQL